ncbi:lysophospholipid transporter LplT [Nitrogeniibacter mangrovi]|uniref:Lysophospholipid transporter LplT n=1 Tax=Nitrogeniibacter mangrovi TaxID=2016596 RepID=A0A6C1B5F9_9RHOO|nr:lysophospholipid transporter LplT [Nitrogeniibacter mangrovi]QID17530.1 lysophospholipid transporter LplT [Nitrogeniibacter mangrovi]
MPLGFYIIMAAQFFSALADNALLIVSIGLLKHMQAPEQYEPLLKFFFTISYVLLAAFVGAYADSMPKWRVMLISNTIKIGGCAMMFFGLHPLLAYAVVGLGAAAYSPAKYGILTEYLPHRLLVVANGWIEGLTIGAIILGTGIGGALIFPGVSDTLLSLSLPLVKTPFEMALLVVGLIYLIAAIFNLFVPDTGVDHKPLKNNPLYLLHDFNHCLKLLWRDKLGQISLAVTTLFWGAGATLQFIVLKWADDSLGIELSKASLLQGVVAIGISVGAVLAARKITLRGSPGVIPLGVAMGLSMLLMVAVPHIPPIPIADPALFGHTLHIDLRVLGVMALLIAVGAMAGFFVVPMNALLQHRGHILMGAGHSIAVQNFNENLSILVMIALYALLVWLDVSVSTVIVLFGLFVAATMLLVQKKHNANQREFDNVALLDDSLH